MPNNQAFAYVMYVEYSPICRVIERIREKMRAFPMLTRKSLSFAGFIKYNMYKIHFPSEHSISLQKIVSVTP